MVPSPSLSNRENASLNSAICSSVRWIAILGSNCHLLVAGGRWLAGELGNAFICPNYWINSHQNISPCGSRQRFIKSPPMQLLLQHASQSAETKVVILQSPPFARFSSVAFQNSCLKIKSNLLCILCFNGQYCSAGYLLFVYFPAAVHADKVNVTWSSLVTQIVFTRKPEQSRAI